ncbi:MAG: FtsX-like permease family protein [Rhodoplanes sp.]
MVTDAMRFLEGVVSGARAAVDRGVRSVRGGAARPVLPLVFVLASRNLFQDRVRLIATVVGIVFSIILVTVQIGLFLSFERMVTTMIDHAEADLWIMPRGTKCFEDPSLLDERERFRALSIPGVTKAVPLVIGFAEWKLPNGGATPVFVVGSDENSAGLQPWNIIAGSLDQLATPDAVAVDQSYFERLGVSGLGDVAEMRDRKAKVAVITRGIRSFTTTPYVFTSFDRARSYIGISPNKATYFLVRVSPNYDLESVRRQTADNATDTEVLTSEEFRVRSRSFWLFGTGAGAALFAGALLGIIVGTVIVAQTLYSSTKDHLKEFATLRAIGSSSIYIVKVILWQALLSAVIGFCIAAAIGLLIVQMTADTALPVVMTPGLMVGLFVLTLVMCAVSAISAILEVMRMDPAMVFAR